MAQYFNLTLDTTAPTSGVISGLDAYYNSSATATLAADGAAFMKVWTNQTAVGTSSDAEIPSSWEVYDTSKTVSFSAQGTNYVHAMFMDEVGNIGVVVNSSAVVFDNVAPTISAVSIEDGAGYTRVATVDVEVSFSDATSGVASVTLAGDIADAEKTTYNVTDAERTAGSKTISVTLQGADGTKTVSATVTDRAGNTSTSASDSIILDTSAATGTLVLRNAGDTANLPAYVNDVDYAAAIETEDTDIVAYKLWEGSTEPSEWTSVTQDPSNPRILIENLEFSTGDGTKTINCKIQDVAGNVTTLTPVSAVLDTAAPTVTLSGSPTVISAVTGYDTVTFTLSASDTNAAQGLNYILRLGTAGIKAGTLTVSGTSGSGTVDVTAAEIEAISSGQGNKSFTLEVTDIAGNTGTSTEQVITLDKTAPTGSVTAETYYNSSSISVTVAGSDTGGSTMSKMKVWLDSNEPSTWEDFAAGTYAMTSVAEGEHTAHIKLMDAVGNASSTIDSSSFIVDTTAPTASPSIPSYSNTKTITVTLNASDAKSGIEVSGLASMKVWQHGTTEPSSWENYAATKSVTIVGDDGDYQFDVKVKDNAGNESTAFTSNTCRLDQDEPAPSIVLYKSDDSVILPARVNTTGFVAHIASTDTVQSEPLTYQLSGDFTDSPLSGTLTYDTGKQYMTIADLDLTSGDGLKTITLALTDSAGNTNSASATVTLDTSAPTVTVANVDYNIVSKEHTARLNSSAEAISGAYNDMMTFTFSADEALIAWKVCVNEPEQTAAGAEPIGTTHGSQNMSGGAVAANTSVSCTIMGADFAETDKVNDTDGAYEVIVYGQDEAGTWSAIHVIYS